MEIQWHKAASSAVFRSGAICWIWIREGVPRNERVELVICVNSRWLAPSVTFKRVAQTYEYGMNKLVYEKRSSDFLV